MEEKNINQRIAIIIDDKKTNPNSFASQLGIKAAIIYNILKERNKPGYDLLTNICETFNVNANWLLTGNGSMYQENISNDIIQNSKEDMFTNDEINAALTSLAKSNLMYLEIHLSDIYLNLKLLQENLSKQPFDRKEYEQSIKDISAIFKTLKDTLKSKELGNKSIVSGLLKLDEGIKIYLDNIKDLSKNLHLHYSN